ncbi:homoserine dehydrogenase [Okibacterium fritillariae]|uniref:homoserine dehydrogenase n=1 Tax=Okibacterium fritillariae TaxID=123320 RepID=UPI0040558483
MTYAHTAPAPSEPITVALTGASGGFGRTFLAQLAVIPTMRPSILVDLNLPALSALLDDLGYDRATWQIVDSAADVESVVADGRTALISDAALLAPSSYRVLVEATGNMRAGFAFARQALDAERHVVMVSKEVESLSGVFLSELARERGVSYQPGMGDQPANLLALLSWVQAVGLEVVAVGKSSEYDLTYDPATGMARQLDVDTHAPALGDLLELGDDLAATLAARHEATRAFKRAAAADYCEMAVVSQYTGFTPDVETMHYPIARPDELADIYSLREHGGILENSGATDVFSMLRLPGEASFAGGEFVIVKTHDAETWRMLRGKGHVVSRDGRYAAIFHPYHLMGIETPLSVLSAVDPHRVAAEPRQHTILSGRAEIDLAAGTALTVAGHHHEIAGVAPVLRATPETAPNVAPFYLLGGCTLSRPVAAGELLTIDDLDGVDLNLWAAFQAGRALSGGTE